MNKIKFIFYGLKGWACLSIFTGLVQFNDVEANQVGLKLRPSEMLLHQDHCFFQSENNKSIDEEKRLQSVCVNTDSKNINIKLNTTGTDLAYHSKNSLSGSEKTFVEISGDETTIIFSVPLNSNNSNQEFWVGVTDEKNTEKERRDGQQEKPGDKAETGGAGFVGHAIGAVVMITADSFSYFIGLPSSIWGSKKNGIVASATKPFDYILLASSITIFDGLQQSLSEQLGPVLSHAGTASIAGASSWAAYALLNRMKEAGVGYIPASLANYLFSPAVTQFAKSIKASSQQVIRSFGGDPDMASVAGQAVTAGIMWTAALGVGTIPSNIAVKLLAPGLGIGAAYQTMELFNQVLGEGMMASLAGFLAGYGLLSVNAGNHLPELPDSLVEASGVTVVEVVAKNENEVFGISMTSLLVLMFIEYSFPTLTGDGVFARVQKNTLSAMAILVGFGMYQYLAHIAAASWLDVNGWWYGEKTNHSNQSFCY